MPLGWGEHGARLAWQSLRPNGHPVKGYILNPLIKSFRPGSMNRCLQKGSSIPCPFAILFCIYCLSDRSNWRVNAPIPFSVSSARGVTFKTEVAPFVFLFSKRPAGDNNTDHSYPYDRQLERNGRSRPDSGYF